MLVSTITITSEQSEITLAQLLRSHFPERSWNQVRRLIETRNPFRTAGFAKADSGAAQHFFDRGFESEADMLGLQYMYKAGYDPTASIDLFERMLSLEKRNPGVIAKVFNTHPMTSDRITKTQQNIAEMLADRPEFVVNTSEFNEVRERLKSRYVKRKGNDPNRPRLRRTPSAGEPGAADSDEKPTLKRRDLVD